MTDESVPKPGPTPSNPQPQVELDPPAQAKPDAVDSAPAQAKPDAVDSAPAQEEGVKTEGLVYTEIEGGLRRYPAQQPVETVDEPADAS